MGNGLSEEEKREREQRELDRFVSRLSDGPDVKVNQNMLKFCSLSSSDMLTEHYQRRMEASDCAADWMKNLAEKLAALTPGPELAGLGALAIAIFIDIVSFSPPEESVKDALRCVFAEEKASEVWDQITECLKTCEIYLNNEQEMRSNLEQIKRQLSMALTKLKNSMLRDGHMTNEALKAWVNGAAFHIQMLIHLVRLGGTDTCDSVKNLLSYYERELDLMFTEHEKMIWEKCRMERSTVDMENMNGGDTLLVDEDSRSYILYFPSFEKHFEVYYDHRYGRQKREIQQHFRDVRENLQSLVLQRGSINFR